MSGDTLSALYETGHGSITLRGRAALHPGLTGQRLVVIQLPYGVMKGGDGGLILQTADGVRQRSLKATSTTTAVRSMGWASSWTSRPTPTLTGSSILVTSTPIFKINFDVQLTSLVEDQPRTLNLRDLIAEWLSSRLEHQSAHTRREQLLVAAERHNDPRRTTIA